MRLIVILFYLFAPFYMYAWVLDSSITTHYLAPHIEILPDEDHAITFESLQESKPSRVEDKPSKVEDRPIFQPCEKNFLYRHFTDTHYWIRLSLASEVPLAYVLHIPTSWIDTVTLYYVDDKGKTQTFVSGDRVPQALRSIDHKDIAFDIALDVKPKEFYLHIQSRDAMQVPIYAVQKSAFDRKSDTELLLFGIFFGIFSIMIFYNLFYFFYVKDSLNGIYALYVLFFALMVASTNGYLLHYLWPDWMDFNEMTYNITLMAYLGFMLLFAKNFLQVQAYSPLWERIMRYGAFFYLSLAVASMVLPYPLAMEIGVYSAAVIPFFVVVPSILGFKSPNRRWAMLYFAGWLPNFMWYVVWALGFFGWLPYSFFTAHGNVIGVLTELLVFSFAMIYRIQTVMQSNVQLEHDIQFDALTGAKNRYAFNDTFPVLVNQAQEHNKEIYFAIMDIDNFKRYNDTYGHVAGDKALKTVAGALSAQLQRSCDALFRLGGEEFGVVLCARSQEEALEATHRLREAVIQASILFEGVPNGVITASFGLAIIDPKEIDDYITVYKYADDLLYKAKSEGKNCVVWGRYTRE